MKLLGDQGMRKILPLSLLVALTLLGSNVNSANAAVITYTNESTFRAATPSHNPPVQSFESANATNTSLLTSLSPGQGAAPFTITSQQSGVTFGVYDQKDVFGAHATDGDKHIVTSGSEGISQTYSINFHFDVPVSSFGLWVTDFGDQAYGADLLLGATFVGGAGQAFTIDHVGGTPNANANQQFFGVISNGPKFTDFQLVVTRDAIGFDEVYYDTENVPEPSTLALGAIGMMGLGFWRRKRAAV
jgi:hypothetical protein